ncbi:MAG: hypothetical protein PHO16_04290 [Candidatus Cloacimonetes bacterium]|nr:hypothetical protein [Candidatus Cloacimonadota bacterium]
MSTLRLLIVLALCILVLSSCENGQSKSLPSVVGMINEPEEDFYLIVERYESEYAEYGNLSLISKHSLISLEINGQPCSVDFANQNEVTDYYQYSFHSVWPAYDEEISYSLEFDNKTITGSLAMPSRYILGNWSFDHQEDYTLNWFLKNNPRMQWIDYTFNETSFSDVIKIHRELMPNHRMYTLERASWSDLELMDSVTFTLQANNFRYTNGGLVWLISAYQHGMWIPSQSSGLQRIEQLINKQIVLPR